MYPQLAVEPSSRQYERVLLEDRLSGVQTRLRCLLRGEISRN